METLKVGVKIHDVSGGGVEKTGNGKSGTRKSMTLMHRQYASLQTEASTDRVTTDAADSLSRSSSSHALGSMKPSPSTADFRARDGPRVQTVVTPPRPPAGPDAAEADAAEANEKPRSRTSNTEGGFVGQMQPQQQQQQQLPLSTDLSPNNSFKGSEGRTPKSNEKDDSFDQLNTANAAAKHRKDRFVKNFPDVAASDELLEYYYCAYSRDILFPGFMYVTHEWICFHSKIMGRKDIRIPVQSIVTITKARTAKLIPNAICISTHHERHVFASLVSRDRTFSLLMKIWKPPPSKTGDDDSLNESSQNGERNYVNDDISVSSDDVTPSGSDDSPFGENRSISKSQETLMTGSNMESPEVVSRRQRVNNDSSNRVNSHDVKNQSGANSDSSPVVNSRDRQAWPKDFTVQKPSSSTTTLVLTLTTILIAFLILSAGLLAVRVIQLQAQMEATLIPPPTSSSSSHSFVSEHGHQDEVSEGIYQLKHEHRLNTIQRLHTLLEIHLKLLDKVNQSLKDLQQSSEEKSCSDFPAEEYVQDANS